LIRTQLKHHRRNRKSCQKLTTLTSNLALVEIHSAWGENKHKTETSF
jgi:hypothetical protein